MHAVAFGSRLLYLGLVLSVLLVPGTFITESEDGRVVGAWSLGVRDVVLLLASVAALLEVSADLWLR